MFLVSALLGGSPGEFDGDAPVEVEIGPRDMRIGQAGSSAPSTWASGPAPSPPDSCKD